MQGLARREGSSLRLRGREGRRCTRRLLVGGDVREPQASFGFQPAWGLRAGGQRAVRILCLVGFQHRAGDAAQALGEEPSGLDFVLWPDCGCFLSLDRFPLCLHLPISLIKFALWTSGRPRRPKLFSKQEAGHARCGGRPWAALGVPPGFTPASSPGSWGLCSLGGGNTPATWDGRTLDPGPQGDRGPWPLGTHLPPNSPAPPPPGWPQGPSSVAPSTSWCR